MAQAGISVPTYAYAANNPIIYTDPDGRRLHVSPWARLFYPADAVARLEAAVDELNKQACECALTSGGGYSRKPWDWWPVVVGFDDYTTSKYGLDGYTNQLGTPVPNIFLDSSMSVRKMTSTIAHEGGHLRFPFLGHDEDNPERARRRFEIPENHCGPQKFVTDARAGA